MKIDLKLGKVLKNKTFVHLVVATFYDFYRQNTYSVDKGKRT